MTMYLMDQYDLDRLRDLPKSLITLLASMIIAGCIATGVLFFTPKYVFGREALLLQALFAFLLLALWRIGAINFLVKKTPRKKLAVVGHGQIISGFIEDLSRLSHSGLTISNICVTDKVAASGYYEPGTVISHRNVTDMLRIKDFDALAFDSTNGYFSNEEVREILRLKFQGKAVHDLSALYENITGKVPITYIDGQWLLKSPELQGSLSMGYLRVKRVMDILLSSFFLILTAPSCSSSALSSSLRAKGRYSSCKSAWASIGSLSSATSFEPWLGMPRSSRDPCGPRRTIPGSPAWVAFFGGFGWTSSPSCGTCGGEI